MTLHARIASLGAEPRYLRNHIIICSIMYQSAIYFPPVIDARRVFVGIVKISDELHEATKIMARAMSRSINSQAEYWIRIGKLVEENPSITYVEVLKILVDQATLNQNEYVSEDA